MSSKYKTLRNKSGTIFQTFIKFKNCPKNVKNLVKNNRMSCSLQKFISHITVGHVPIPSQPGQLDVIINKQKK